jgi:ribosomal-protein-alanine N-acetyltransferase
MLMDQLLEDAQKLEADTVLLEVRASNQPAITLYHVFGFNEIGVRRNYYPGTTGREDALIFAKVLFKTT